VVDKQYEQSLGDLLKREQAGIETGGAKHFLRFITEELMPVMEARYRMDSEDKTLLGHSTGGHFALYTLLNEQQLFQRYIVGSPSLGIGHGVLFNMESDYAKKHQELPVKLFMGIGEEEEHSSFSPASYLDTIVSVSDYFRFAAIIEDRAYLNLKFSTKLFEGYGHTDVIGPVISMGLKHVFASD
jgi:predicted alpha/beta superfamily hydrolase